MKVTSTQAEDAGAQAGSPDKSQRTGQNRSLVQNSPGTPATIMVRVRVYERARNFRLRIGPDGEPVISVPARGDIGQAERFLHEHENWLTRKLREHPEPVPFADGEKIPIRGQLHEIRATRRLRGLVETGTRTENETGPAQIPLLLVPGDERHMARRLEDWLKKQARIDLEAASHFHAERLGVQIRAINIRAQSGRWGSCSSSGRLNYNWRLIMAPGFVLDYVAAHEVAHICELNHSQAFWARVRQTLADMERGRDWLKKNGNQLMAYGQKKRLRTH